MRSREHSIPPIYETFRVYLALNILIRLFLSFVDKRSYSIERAAKSNLCLSFIAQRKHILNSSKLENFPPRESDPMVSKICQAMTKNLGKRSVMSRFREGTWGCHCLTISRLVQKTTNEALLEEQWSMRQSHRRALGLRAQSYMLNKIERPEKSHFHLFLSPCLTPALKGTPAGEGSSISPTLWLIPQLPEMSCLAGRILFWNS